MDKDYNIYGEYLVNRRYKLCTCGCEPHCGQSCDICEFCPDCECERCLKETN